MSRIDYEKDLLSSPCPGYIFNKEFCFRQNNLGLEENREDEENGFYSPKNPTFDEDQTKLFLQNQNDSYGDQLLEQDNNIDEKNLPKQESLNKPICQIKLDLISQATKYTTKILGQKTIRNDEEKENKLNQKSKKIKNNQNLNYNENNEITKNCKDKKIQGRKKKEEKEKGNHTKYSEDNIMRKIKSHFFNKFNILLNKSII